MGGVSKGKINLVELSNVRVNGQSSYRMLTVISVYYKMVSDVKKS